MAGWREIGCVQVVEDWRASGLRLKGLGFLWLGVQVVSLWILLHILRLIGKFDTLYYKRNVCLCVIMSGGGGADSDPLHSSSEPIAAPMHTMILGF